MAILNFKEAKTLSPVVFRGGEGNHVLVNNYYLTQHTLPDGNNGLQPSGSCSLEMEIDPQFDTVSTRPARSFPWPA